MTIAIACKPISVLTHSIPQNFQQDKRWGYFPSLSAGWTLSNEKFFKNLVPDNIVSFAKLRASWGRNGNINVLSGYKYSSSIATGGQWYQYSNGTTVTNGSMPSGLANPNLTWETSDQLDFGLDLRLFNDALTNQHGLL